MSKSSITLIVVGVMALILITMWGFPTYNVWQKGLAGEADLRRAEEDRRIAVLEALAAKDSAEHLGQAEVLRATHAATAIAAIKKELKDAEGEMYLRYLWILGLHDGNGETIYIPTEANLPLLEATRRK